jgi:hypothetical protein
MRSVMRRRLDDVALLGGPKGRIVVMPTTGTNHVNPPPKSDVGERLPLGCDGEIPNRVKVEEERRQRILLSAARGWLRWVATAGLEFAGCGGRSHQVAERCVRPARCQDRRCLVRIDVLHDGKDVQRHRRCESPSVPAPSPHRPGERGKKRRPRNLPLPCGVSRRLRV